MKIDPKSSVPLFQQIVDAIERRILTGELVAGAFIPSVRDLAVELVVNPNTVAKAYQQLQVLKLVAFERGRGLRVVGIKEQKSDDRRHAMLATKVDELLAYAAELGFTNEDVATLITSEERRELAERA